MKLRGVEKDVRVKYLRLACQDALMAEFGNGKTNVGENGMCGDVFSLETGMFLGRKLFC